MDNSLSMSMGQFEYGTNGYEYCVTTNIETFSKMKNIKKSEK